MSDAGKTRRVPAAGPPSTTDGTAHPPEPPTTVRLVVENRDDAERRVTVRLDHADGTVLERTVTLVPGERTTVVVERPAGRLPVHADLTVDGADTTTASFDAGVETVQLTIREGGAPGALAVRR